MHVYPRNNMLGRAIRTGRHRMVEWKVPGAAAATAEYELYDYEKDPLETRNLADAELEVLAGDPGRGGLEALIARNVAIKAAIVSEDEFETKGLRALLNFGHTIGHGIEASAGYGEMLHGEAISLGMRAALRLSEEFAGLDAAVSRRLVRLLGMWRLPLVLPGSIGTATVLEKMGRDKKFDHGRLKFVLLRAAGDAFVSGEVTAAAAERAIEGLREAPGE